MSNYENINQKLDDNLFAIGSGGLCCEPDKESEEKEKAIEAVKVASRKDLAMILTHDDPFNIDHVTDGLLFQRVKSEYSLKELLKAFYDIQKTYADDAFMSEIGLALEIFDDSTHLGADSRDWEDRVRHNVPVYGSTLNRQGITLDQWLEMDNGTRDDRFARQSIKKLKELIEG